MVIEDPSRYRLHVFVCTSEKDDTRCGKKGGFEVVDALRARLGERGCVDVKVTKSGCVNIHPCGVAVTVYPDGVWYKEVRPEDAAEIVDSHFLGGRPVQRLVHGTLGGSQAPATPPP